MRPERGTRGAGGRVGVYVGIQQMEYGGLAGPFLERVGPFSATGGPFSVAAGRLSYTYALRGPAVRRMAFVPPLAAPELQAHLSAHGRGRLQRAGVHVHGALRRRAASRAQGMVWLR